MDWGSAKWRGRPVPPSSSSVCCLFLLDPVTRQEPAIRQRSQKYQQLARKPCDRRSKGAGLSGRGSEDQAGKGHEGEAGALSPVQEEGHQAMRTACAKAQRRTSSGRGARPRYPLLQLPLAEPAIPHRDEGGDLGSALSASALGCSRGTFPVPKSCVALLWAAALSCTSTCLGTFALLFPGPEYHLRRLHSQTSPLLPALLTRRLLDTTHPATLYKLPPRNPLRPRPLVLWLRLVPVKALLPFSHFLQFTCDSNSLLFSVPSAETPAPARQGAPACLPHST